MVESRFFYTALWPVLMFARGPLTFKQIKAECIEAALGYSRLKQVCLKGCMCCTGCVNSR